MFTFSDDLPIPRDPTLVVPIRATIQTKQELLQAFAEGLNFPSYFGWNWDALDECLRDLSWITFPRDIVLFHEAIPFVADSSERAIYLEILEDALKDWGPGQPHVLTVIFPEAWAVDMDQRSSSD